jgi:hemolysin III
MKGKERIQSIKEEIANAVTHGAGVVFSLIAIPFLITYAVEKGNAATVWSASAFSFGMLMVYLSSTLYHAIQHPKAKFTLRVWDHISIFLMIAGSYTPILQKYADDATATSFLIALWAFAIVGIVKKIFFTGRFEWFSLIVYLAMGWMSVFIIGPLSDKIPDSVFNLIVAGGICYTVGVVFYVWKNLLFQHAIWHAFVLGGTITHFFAIYYSIPYQLP